MYDGTSKLGSSCIKCQPNNINKNSKLAVTSNYELWTPQQEQQAILDYRNEITATLTAEEDITKADNTKVI